MLAKILVTLLCKREAHCYETPLGTLHRVMTAFQMVLHAVNVHCTLPEADGRLHPQSGDVVLRKAARCEPPVSSAIRQLCAARLVSGVDAACKAAATALRPAAEVKMCIHSSIPVHMFRSLQPCSEVACLEETGRCILCKCWLRGIVAYACAPTPPSAVKVEIGMQAGVFWQGKQGAQQKEDTAKEDAQKRRGTEESALQEVSQFLTQMQDTKVSAARQ